MLRTPRLAFLILTLLPLAALQASPFGRQGTIKFRVDSPEKRGELLNRGAQVVQDYGSFSIMEAAPALLDEKDDVEKLPDEDRVLLNSGELDTRQDEVKKLQRPRARFAGKSLHMIQFAGPTQPEWLDELKQTGVKIVSYIPSNTYLVYGDASQLSSVQALASKPHVQWDAPYQDNHKIHPRARARQSAKGAAAPGNLYSIQLVEDAAANPTTVQLINQLKSGPMRSSYSALSYLNMIVPIPADKLDQIAKQADVVSIQPYSECRLFDERQDQIIAGNLSGSSPSGPGYLSWLASQGFTQAQFTSSNFIVDITDSGVDNGTTSPNHFGLYLTGTIPGTSRVVYNRLQGTANSGSTLKGCDGHGTINSHIIAGYSTNAGFPFQDDTNYQYGLGVCPFIKVGSSVIFDPSTFTNPNYQNLQSQAYNDNARVSSNSWGADNSGGYDTRAQTYDALVRDAQPTGATFAVAGNQQMVIVFANGNAGPGAQTVGTPATAKNIISVGAAENVRTGLGIDGCQDPDTTADNANDIIDFSSRGTCADGRIKPDIVAPGVRITGGLIQTASPGATGTADSCFTGSAVCGGSLNTKFFPTNGQQFYTISSGTSHSTPAVAGACALIRQFFLNQSLAAPSPAMTKAILMNSARYLTGVYANDTLWSNTQGMGEMNLGEAFLRGTTTPTILRDQEAADMFTATGQSRMWTGSVADNTKPLRVTLVWTDAPGSTSGAAYVNNLDLTVTIGGSTYKGNVFAGQYSTIGGTADAKNNVENVSLPAGISGNVAIKVTATAINGDGVPNTGGSLDQDFALVIYNVNSGTVPVLASAGSTIATESCPAANNAVDPGETVTVNLSLINLGSGNSDPITGTLLASSSVLSPSGPQDFGVIPAGGAAVSRPFTFTANTVCGSTITAALQLSDGSTAYFPFVTGAFAPIFSQNFDASSSLPAGWTATVNAGTIAPWAISTTLKDTTPNAAYTQDPTTNNDNWLTSPTIAISSSQAKLTFRHSYDLESTFDGGVLEISINAGAFADFVTVGGTFASGGYNSAIVNGLYHSSLLNRSVWSGNSGGFITTTATFPAAAAGQNIQLRWRMGSDDTVGRTGWYVDTISISEPSCCVTPICNTPFADFDGDGDVDQNDFAAFQLCIGTATGPCACFDRNASGQVDASDFAIFDQCEAGADQPPLPGCPTP